MKQNNSPTVMTNNCHRSCTLAVSQTQMLLVGIVISELSNAHAHIYTNDINSCCCGKEPHVSFGTHDTQTQAHT